MGNMQKRQKQISLSQKGFSMMEVLVVMAIIPIGMLGVAKTQHNIMSVSGESKTRAEALHVAEQKIEEIKSFVSDTDYAEITTGNDTVAANTGSNANLTRTWTVTDTASPNYKTIVANVEWTGSDNISKSVAITSYVSMSDPVASGEMLLADSTATPSPTPTPTPTPDPSPDPDPTPDPDPDPTPDPSPDPDPTPAPTSYTVTVSGLISYQGNGTNTWTVSFDGTQCDSASNSGSYSCTISGVALGDTPTFTVSFASTSATCGTSSVTKSFSSGSTYATHDFIHAQNSSKC